MNIMIGSFLIFIIVYDVFTVADNCPIKVGTSYIIIQTFLINISLLLISFYFNRFKHYDVEKIFM
jgi:predicted Na+-dependent transporter